VTYLDTSALLKRFVAETGSVVVNALVGRHGPVATATIAYAEAHAAFARRRRARDLSERQYASTCRQFEHEWGAWVHIDLDDDVLGLARDLIRRHPLSGFDAIHLASALAFRTMLGEELAFAAADAGLFNAARDRLAVGVDQDGPALGAHRARGFLFAWRPRQSANSRNLKFSQEGSSRFRARNIAASTVFGDALTRLAVAAVERYVVFQRQLPERAYAVGLFHMRICAYSMTNAASAPPITPVIAATARVTPILGRE